MMLTWIGYAMLCSAAVAALAASAEYAFGNRRYARRALWIVAIVASAGIPVAAAWLSKAPTVVRRDEYVEMTQPVADVARAVWSTDRIVQVAWVAVSLAAALWLYTFHIGLNRRLRRCPRVNVSGRSTVVSPDFGPAVVGVLRPRIVLPKWALALDETDRRVILTHEAEHMRAHDPAMHFVALALVVLFPWNVALWWQLKRLRLAIEIDCDARVVARHGHDPIRYGELLVTAHANSVQPIVAALALVQRRSALGRRIDALVSLPPRSAVRVLGAVVTGVGCIAAVAFAPAPSLRDPIVIVEPRTALNRLVEVPVADTPRVVRSSQAALRVPSRAPANAVGRRVPTLRSQPLPPLRVTPMLTETAVPQAAVAKLPTVTGFAAGRGGRGGGFAGGMMVARPSSPVAVPGRVDTLANRGGGGGRAMVVRAGRPDSIPPRP